MATPWYSHPMRYRQTPEGVRASCRVGLIAVSTVLVLVAGSPPSARATPCVGAKKLRLSWSPRSHAARVFVSMTLCDPPAPCSASTHTADGLGLTAPPITLTLSDASGHGLTGTFAARAPINRGGCPGGTETLGGQFNFIFGNERGQTTVMGRHLVMRSGQAPALAPPITVRLSDARGYRVEAVMTRCRSRESAAGVSIDCNDSGGY